MVGFLKGKIALKDGQYIYVDVQGVGYKVQVVSEVLAKPLNEVLTIYTYTHIREDAMELFGFLRFEDLKLFEKLISVSGIGPKTAINIFSSGDGDQITQAIIAGNVDFFTAVPKLGKKNAQKIIIELKNKIGESREIDINSLDSNVNEELVSALKSIGFSIAEIQKAVKNIKEKDITVEEKIKLALKYMGK
ncbi:Holliday junction branch migration protein RuvA [Candidatus Parcubacteria bacterium]|nr:MAG: Holliday junction branch migration protein RuvA [Candidatus Parcubacteria bacterium]